jgi:anthranilate phosphoribosyltransferase
VRQTSELLARGSKFEAHPIQRPPASVTDALYRITGRLALPTGLLSQALNDLSKIKDLVERSAHLAALMTGLMARGPVRDDVVEILRAALSLDHAQPAHPRLALDGRLVVVAGSGKKGLKTFNISTPSAIVAAAAGASIIKVGSRATSSAMGSRDLVGHLGLREARTAEDALAEVGRAGFAFIPIEDTIPAVDAMYGGRFHTINPFSFGLTALAAPIRGDVLVYGLAHPNVELGGQILSDFGIADAVVIASGNGEGYYADELGVGPRTLMCHVQGARVSVAAEQDIRALPGYSANDHRLPSPPTSQVEAATWALEAISGHGLKVHVWLIAVNAALLLQTARIVPDLEAGYELATEMITSGEASKKVAELQEEALCRP